MRERIGTWPFIHAPGGPRLSNADVYGLYTACGKRFTNTYAAGGGWTGTATGEYIASPDMATCPDCKKERT